MNLHFHPVSTSSLPVVLFCAESGIAYEPLVVDLKKGDHKKESFLKLNPRGLVPVLEDDGFVLTESASILKYLAEKVGSPAYPDDLRKRARVNERLDWFNNEIVREICYNLVYPQLLPNYARPDAIAQRSTLTWGKEKAEHALAVFDEHGIGHHAYLCGDEITIVDYYAVEVFVLAAALGASYAKYPNLERWLATMKALPSWAKVHEAVDGLAASLAGKTFVAVGR